MNATVIVGYIMCVACLIYLYIGYRWGRESMKKEYESLSKESVDN
jgi:Na+-driven multidrug efflux pump